MGGRMGDDVEGSVMREMLSIALNFGIRCRRERRKERRERSAREEEKKKEISAPSLLRFHLPYSAKRAD